MLGRGPLRGHLFEDGEGLAGVLLVAQPHLHDGPGEPDRLVAERPQLTSRHHEQLAIELANLDESESHVLDRPRVGPDPDQVPVAEGVVEEEEEARDDVLDERLGPEADGEPGDARACQERANIEPDHRQDRDDGDGPDHVAGHRPEEVGRREHTLPALVGGRVVLN